jgi:hypothetical protein
MEEQNCFVPVDEQWSCDHADSRSFLASIGAILSPFVAERNREDLVR